MSDGTVVGRRLVKLVGEYSSPLDRDGLAARLEQEWSPDCLALLLTEHEPRIVEAAACALGLVGNESNTAALADLLHHDDVDVVSAAEEALQYIAFRSAGALPQKVLMRLVSSIKEEDSDSAITLITELIRSHPTYAEAYHQRSHLRDILMQVPVETAFIFQQQQTFIILQAKSYQCLDMCFQFCHIDVLGI